MPIGGRRRASCRSASGPAPRRTSLAVIERGPRCARRLPALPGYFAAAHVGSSASVSGLLAAIEPRELTKRHNLEDGHLYARVTAGEPMVTARGERPAHRWWRCSSANRVIGPGGEQRPSRSTEGEGSRRRSCSVRSRDGSRRWKTARRSPAGSYAGCSTGGAAARCSQPILRDVEDRLIVAPEPNSYNVTVVSKRDSNVSFAVHRTAGGTTSRTCTVGTGERGGCKTPATGVW